MFSKLKFSKLNLIRRSLQLATLSTLLSLGGCYDQGEQIIQISDAEIRDLLPSRDTTAAYFNILNNSGKTVTLNGARSIRARAIEMHKTVITRDSVGMHRVKQQTIEQGETLKFEPGGLHLMVFGVSEMSEPFPITLLFADGQQIDVSFSKLAN